MALSTAFELVSDLKQKNGYLSEQAISQTPPISCQYFHNIEVPMLDNLAWLLYNGRKGDVLD